MPSVRTRVWTERRKTMGNLVPAVFWAIPAIAGLGVMVGQGNLLGLGLAFLMGATLAGWLATGWFGLYQNLRMRQELSSLLLARGENLDGAIFVGLATPRHSGILDAHEDVGFLLLKADRLRYVGENRVIEIYRNDIGRIRLRPSVHTLVGLGGWISIEGEVQGSPIRVSIEPRESATMFGNARRRRPLSKRLEGWRRRGLS